VSAPEDWYTLPVLAGRSIRLEPLAIEHAEGYFLAAGTGEVADEVFRWLKSGPPDSVEAARGQIARALFDRSQGQRLPYVQIDAITDTVAGTTSLYEINPALRTLGIGHTWLGRPWWRTGANTESKLLLLRYAFDDLGAARVVWHTDIYNERSQAAIARLGATREGVLRKHRIRRDGSWRDSVQYSMTDEDWPGARTRLEERLALG
jgi:RimJ/RimL family protein N-acetyltransferase